MAPFREVETVGVLGPGAECARRTSQRLVVRKATANSGKRRSPAADTGFAPACERSFSSQPESVKPSVQDRRARGAASNLWENACAMGTDSQFRRAHRRLRERRSDAGLATVAQQPDR